MLRGKFKRLKRNTKVKYSEKYTEKYALYISEFHYEEN